MFKDFKNSGRGFGLELTGVRQAERLERLLLAWALVYILLRSTYNRSQSRRSRTYFCGVLETGRCSGEEGAEVGKVKAGWRQTVA